MGLNILFSRCSCNDTPVRVRDRPAGNPDPSRFDIRHVAVAGRYLVALVHYPDCTNYEGKKILVFRDLTEKQLRRLSTLDPHFCDSDKHPLLVARFLPTKEGMTMALATALMLDAEMK